VTSTTSILLAALLLGVRVLDLRTPAETPPDRGGFGIVLLLVGGMALNLLVDSLVFGLLARASSVPLAAFAVCLVAPLLGRLRHQQYRDMHARWRAEGEASSV